MGSVFSNPRTAPSSRKTYRKPLADRSDRQIHPKQREQQIVIAVCKYVRREYLEAIITVDYAAGLELKDNQRKMMMAMRSEDGMPDITIDYPSRGYHGLRIEAKKEGTKIYCKDGKTLRKQPYKRSYWVGGKKFLRTGDHLAEQAATLKKYNDMGYFARFGVGEAKIIQLIDWYFDKKLSLDVF
jgi:hypothetical protein